MTSNETTILERRFVPQGSVIMKQGEEGHSAFLVQSGLVKVTASSESKTVELATLGVGQIFGEMALIFDEPRSATVEALEDCNLIVINRETFHKKLNQSDATVKAIVPMLMKRIIESNNVVLDKKSSLSGLEDTVKSIYKNIHTAAPATQKKSLENIILPKLDDFLQSISDFKERYS